MANGKIPVVVCWSGGKDCAWALHQLRNSAQFDPVGLLTMFVGESSRVSMHGVRREVIHQQVLSLRMPLVEIDLPAFPQNSVYEAGFADGVAEYRDLGVKHVAFGDLFLDDIREYRIGLCQNLGIEPLFPCWGQHTRTQAQQFREAGFQATICALDRRLLTEDLLGRPFNEAFLNELPPGIDACGENGEFHSLVWNGPGFHQPVALHPEGVFRYDSFSFLDLVPHGMKKPNN